MVNAALDTNHQTFTTLLNGGMDPLQANLASTIFTKEAVAAMLEANYNNVPAPVITHGLKTEGIESSKKH